MFGTFFATSHVDLAIVFLRLALGIVFVWFGADKLVHPQFWTGWVPESIAAALPISLRLFIYGNGVIEAAIGVLLLLGKFTRLAAILALLVLASVLAFIGINDVTVRDVGLLGMAAALVLTGGGAFGLDRLQRAANTAKNKN